MKVIRKGWKVVEIDEQMYSVNFGDEIPAMTCMLKESLKELDSENRRAFEVRQI
jgi:hypothetical protein